MIATEPYDYYGTVAELDQGLLDQSEWLKQRGDRVIQNRPVTVLKLRRIRKKIETGSCPSQSAQFDLRDFIEQLEPFADES